MAMAVTIFARPTTGASQFGPAGFREGGRIRYSRKSGMIEILFAAS